MAITFGNRLFSDSDLLLGQLTEPIGGTFNRSPERQKELTVYTAPGSMPSNLSDQYSADVDPYAHAKAALAGYGAGYSLAPGLLDTALMSLRGISKSAAALPFSFGNDIAKATERVIPEPFAQKAVENILLNNQREEIAQKTGELPFLAGNLPGNVVAAVKLASKVPVLGNLFGIAGDIASGTPGASQYLSGAANTAQSIARGAKVGLAGSILPAIDVGYNAQQGTLDPQGAIATLGLGTAMGAGVSALPAIGKSGKELIDNITNAVKTRGAQSDAMATMRQMSERNFKMRQQQQMLEQQQIEKLPIQEPQMVEPTTYSGLGVGDKVVAPRSPVDSALGTLQKDQIDFNSERKNIETSFKQQNKKLESELLTAQKYINEASAEPKVTDIEINDRHQGPKNRNEIRSQIINQKQEVINAQKAELQSQLDTIQKKIDTFNEELSYRGQQLQEDYQRPIADISKDLETEKANLIQRINKLNNQKITVSKKEYQTLADQVNQERDAIRQQILQEKQAQNEQLLADLNKEVEGIYQRIDQTDADYREKIDILNQLQNYQPQLPARLSDLETPGLFPEARFTAGPSGVRDAESNVIAGKPEETNIQQKRLSRWTGTVKENQAGMQAVSFEPIQRAPIKQGIQAELNPIDTLPETEKTTNKKPTVDKWKPITNIIARLNPDLGAAVQKFAVAPNIYAYDIMTQVSDYGNAVKKYSKDPAVMKALGNIEETQDYSTLPTDLAQALENAQPVFRKYAEGLNQKGMDINVSGKIYAPRGWDMEKLQAKIGPVLKDEYKVYSRDIQERYLSRQLEKEKTIPNVTDDLVDALDMGRGLDNWIKNTAEKQAEVDLFGNATGNYAQNVANLMEKYKGGFKSEKDLAEATQTLLDGIAGMKNATPQVHKFIARAISGLLYTGQSVAISQVADLFTSLARHNVFNTLYGTMDTIRTLIPNASKQPILQNTLKKIGALESVDAFADTGQIDKMLDFWSLLKDGDVKTALVNGLANTGLAMNKVSYMLTRMADASGKKVNVLAAHNKFKSDPNLLLKDLAMYEPDPNKRLEIIDYYKGFKNNDKQKYEPVPISVLTYLTNHALAYHVKSPLDRSLTMLSTDGVARWINVGQSFAYKFAATAEDRFNAEIQQAVQSKSLTKPVLTVAEKLGKLAIIIGGNFVLRMMNSGYKMTNESEGLPVTPEAAGSVLADTTMGLLKPGTGRVLKTIGKLQNAKMGDPAVVPEMINQLLPGSKTLGKVGADVGILLAEGRPQDIYNINVNDSFRYMFPRPIMDTVYKLSDKAKDDLSKRAIYQAQNQIAPEKERYDQYERAAKVLKSFHLLDPADVEVLTKGTLGTTEYAKALSRSESAISNLRQYGTTDLQRATPAIVERNAMRAKIQQGIMQLNQDFREQKIDGNQYNQGLIEFKKIKKQYNIR